MGPFRAVRGAAAQYEDPPEAWQGPARKAGTQNPFWWARLLSPDRRAKQHYDAGVAPGAVRLLTDRLELIPLTAAALDALIHADWAQLEAVTHAHFPDPVCAPPLMDDALASMREQVLAEDEDPRHGPWLAISRTTREAVGSVGLSRSLDGEDTLLVGYSIYPKFERRGYATEATTALISWALSLPGTRAIQATIPPWHTPSLRVAEKLGMRQMGTGHDDEVGDVLVFELRPPAGYVQEASLDWT